LLVVETFGGDVSVMISEGLPSDSEEEEDDRLLKTRVKSSERNNDAAQREAGNVEKYINQLKGKLPGKKKKKDSGAKAAWSGKGRHGADQMKGMGGGGGVKMAKKMLAKFDTTEASSEKMRGKGGGKGRKEKTKHKKGKPGMGSRRK